MKLLGILSIVLYFPFLVSADDGLAIRVLFNHGQSLPTGEKCTDEEWASIIATVDATMTSQRRALKSYPKWCKEKCKGYTDNTCIGRHPACDGYRRLDSDYGTGTEIDANARDVVPLSESRDLFKSTTCSEQQAELNAVLNNLEPSLSTDCQAVLKAQREFECLTTITDCDIQRIQLMDADSDTVLEPNFQSGMSVCRWGPTITFEAISDSCVCNVQFVLKNAAGSVIQSRFEYYRPFLLFSNSHPNAQGVVNLYGARLRSGNYTLETYPDSDPSMTRTIAFTVARC
jgi:hypothetical protein